jgi:beta-galactosidase
VKEAGINVVRIAESTWSTHEPQSGVFDFSSVDRVLEAMHQAGISVIVGTPTYAVPTWMVRGHPDVLAISPQGPGRYGARQIMDITNPTYLFYAERIIRTLIGHVKDHSAVIGYQTDNETKHYHTSGPNVQLLFVKYIREKYRTLAACRRE